MDANFQTALVVPVTKVEVKAEPLEPDLGGNAEETPTEREGSPGNQHAGAGHEEQAPTELEDAQADTSQNTSDADERVASAVSSPSI